MTSKRYILITAAYNEEKRIESLIRTVARQTVLPVMWFIVSDGSTDRTDEIIKQYEEEYTFIKYLRQEKKPEFAKRMEKATIAKSRALELAIEIAKGIKYDFIGILDADVTLEPDYYNKVIGKFMENPRLGLCGGGVYNVYEPGKKGPVGFVNPDFVGGPIQMFRKECLLEIGGYAPYGHDDFIAYIKTKMHGWEVRCYPEIRAYQHGMPSNALKDKIPDCFEMGQMDYLSGGLFIFELLRALKRMLSPPYFLAGFSLLMGYLSLYVKREKIYIPEDVLTFIRKEQKDKIKNQIKRIFRFKKS